MLKLFSHQLTRPDCLIGHGLHVIVIAYCWYVSQILADSLLFPQIAEIARLRGETAIGFRNHLGAQINPTIVKSSIITADCKIILIA